MVEDTEKRRHREATVAGIFYPDAAAELEERVSRLLSAAEPSTRGSRVIVCPHASLEYSGDLAALAWKSTLGSRAAPRVVAVLSPLHRAEDSLVYLPESELFDCPLGPVEVERDLVSELHDSSTIFTVSDIPHLEEHGVEVQLPFMRSLFPEAKLLPIVMGSPNPVMVKSLASALALVLGALADDCLLVLSTNLASGADDLEVKEGADRLVESILTGDAKAVLDTGADPRAPVCGAGCLASYLASPLSTGMRAVLLGRHDSARSRQASEERLVEYAAFAFEPGDPPAGSEA